ncbi:unnamed protein product [Litomosoides sigmodontis]|uniref:Uncharacterized protein n=1 Tax=Litomosoides sigmodontis TaxID=42156 RepID=A0A3P6U7W7_LITSI|nr:unnamed protein product [Litomosoides sigmodontis]
MSYFHCFVDLDTIDELRSVYLTPDICAQQQTSARVTTSQYDEFFPEFSEEMDDESDSESDEAMSVATSIMDEELFALRPQHADIFGEEIAVGEEAFIDDVVPRRKKLSRELKKQVNVVSATLTDLSVVVSSLNHVSQGAGYIAKLVLNDSEFYSLDALACSCDFTKITKEDNLRIAVEQHLNRVLADLYDEINNEESHSCTGNTAVDSDKATVKFQFYSVPDDRPPSLKIQIENFRVALDDIILRHLSAFVHDNEKTSVRLNLKIKLVDTQIIAIDPKSKSIRIKLNDCVIEHLKENNVMI